MLAKLPCKSSTSIQTKLSLMKTILKSNRQLLRRRHNNRKIKTRDELESRDRCPAMTRYNLSSAKQLTKSSKSTYHQRGPSMQMQKNATMSRQTVHRCTIRTKTNIFLKAKEQLKTKSCNPFAMKANQTKHQIQVLMLQSLCKKRRKSFKKL